MITYKLALPDRTLYIPAFNDNEAKVLGRQLGAINVMRYAGRFRVAGKLVTKYARV